MSVADIAKLERDSLIVMPNFFQRAYGRIFTELSADAQDWANAATHLWQFRKQRMILREPSPEDIEKHRRSLELMISFGSLLIKVTDSPEFPDQEISAMVSATLQMLKDELTMCHGDPLAEAEAEAVLQKCFPE